jgi:hypothetical protein
MSDCHSHCLFVWYAWLKWKKYCKNYGEINCHWVDLKKFYFMMHWDSRKWNFKYALIWYIDDSEYSTLWSIWEWLIQLWTNTRIDVHRAIMILCEQIVIIRWTDGEWVSLIGRPLLYRAKNNETQPNHCHHQPQQIANKETSSLYYILFAMWRLRYHQFMMTTINNKQHGMQSHTAFAADNKKCPTETRRRKSYFACNCLSAWLIDSIMHVGETLLQDRQIDNRQLGAISNTCWMWSNQHWWSNRKMRIKIKYSELFTNFDSFFNSNTFQVALISTMWKYSNLWMYWFQVLWYQLYQLNSAFDKSILIITSPLYLIL